jgi:hypothetical protein
MDTKKSAGRTGKPEARTAPAKSVAPSKRPSALPRVGASSASVLPAPAAATAKKREKSVPPPASQPVSQSHGSGHGAPHGAAHGAANDNDRAKKMGMGVPSIPRGRLPTGSLHTEAREPAQADRIKQQLTALVNAQQKLGELKRSTNRNFYEIGELLHRIRDQRLYEVKGYSSFEAYVERETSLGQQFCAQAVRIFETFLPAAAHTLGFSRLAAALAALEDEPSGMTAVDSLRGARTAIPPHKL